MLHSKGAGELTSESHEPFYKALNSCDIVILASTSGFTRAQSGIQPCRVAGSALGQKAVQPMVSVDR